MHKQRKNIFCFSIVLYLDLTNASKRNTCGKIFDDSVVFSINDRLSAFVSN